jgi:DNA invertase Pin-like site-specific DNA recombinase
MPKAISYVRFSSMRQTSGSSVERQEGLIAGWLDRNPEYSRSDLCFKDLAKSGYHGEHTREGGGFAKLLAAIEAGAIEAGDVVLVEAIDRVGRQPTFKTLTKVLLPILEAGVKIITLDGGEQVYTEASGDGPEMFMLVAKIQAAYQYSAVLSRRVAESYTLRRNKAKAGVMPKRLNPVWLTPEGVVRENVAPWIKTAFELYVSGVGKATIAKRMRESGVPELAKCSGPTVEGWLRNKAAIGKWETRIDTPDHDVIDDVFPAVIDQALFYKAQLHAERVKTERPVKTASNFLVGLVKCACCGKNYIMQNKDGKPHSLRCHTRQMIKSCENSRTVPKPVMDKVYALTSVLAAREAIQQQQMGVNEKEIAAREVELLEIARRVQELTKALQEVGAIPEVLAALKEAKDARTKAEHDLTLLKRTEVAPAGEHWRQMGEVWKLERDDSVRLSAMLRTVGYAITVHPDGKITTTHSSIEYRYVGVDRREDCYKLKAGEKLLLVSKLSEEDYPYVEPFQAGDVALSEWAEEDYENLRLQYE